MGVIIGLLANALLHLAFPFRHRWNEELHQNGAITKTCRICGKQSRGL